MDRSKKASPEQSSGNDLDLTHEDRVNGLDSHLGLNPLSGFLPAIPPLSKLPIEFKAWEEVASQMPKLLAMKELCNKVRVLPFVNPVLLTRGEELQRAATVFGLLVHAIVNLEKIPFDTVPANLIQLWKEVCHRLNRKSAYLSYADLIVYNWIPIREGKPDRTVENLQVLVQVSGNKEEKIFYLSQVELLYRSRSVVSICSQLSNAILHENAAAAEKELLHLKKVVQSITLFTMGKLKMQTNALFNMDPIIWARTVAPVAVPVQPDQPGVSGTANPYFHVMDELIGRTNYSSFLGKEALKLRETYPQSWKDFLSFAKTLNLTDYVEKSSHAGLKKAFSDLCSAYAGPEGLLETHRKKAVSFLEIAFKAGRSVTIGGFRGEFHDREWEKIDCVFSEALAERLKQQKSPEKQPVQPTEIPYSVLASHSAASNAPWMAINGAIYDLSQWKDRHPGGAPILLLYAGLDATEAFAKHHGSNSYLQILKDDLIGHLPSKTNQTLTSPWRESLDRLTELENSATIEREALKSPHFPVAMKDQTCALEATRKDLNARLKVSLEKEIELLLPKIEKTAISSLGQSLNNLSNHPDPFLSLQQLKQVTLVQVSEMERATGGKNG